MRDPERINPILTQLAEFWKAHPDMRLGQIIDNAAMDNSVWLIEDDVLRDGLRKLTELMDSGS